jgi:hypothetical protein
MTEAERGEEDVGVETELGDMEMLDLHPTQKVRNDSKTFSALLSCLSVYSALIARRFPGRLVLMVRSLI